MICWCWVWGSQDHPCSEIRWTDSRTQPLVTLTVRTSHRGEGRTHGQPVRERTQAESGATSAPMRATRSTPPPLTRANVRPRSERKTGVPPEHVCPDNPGTVSPQHSGELIPAQRTASWPSSQTPWASPAGRFLEGQLSALFTLVHGQVSHSEKGILSFFSRGQISFH